MIFLKENLENFKCLFGKAEQVRLDLSLIFFRS